MSEVLLYVRMPGPPRRAHIERGLILEFHACVCTEATEYVGMGQEDCIATWDHTGGEEDSDLTL